MQLVGLFLARLLWHPTIGKEEKTTMANEDEEGDRRYNFQIESSEMGA
jgi:hypothetical protein